MKILIIGGGSIGKRHIKNLQSLGFSNILCLKRTVDTEFSKENNVEVICSFEEAQAHSIDAVFVCTPTSLHNEALQLAVQMNAAVFMEKPLIHSLEGLKLSQTLAAELDNVFFIGFMLRYHPLVKKIKEILDSKILGNVYNARFEFGSFLPYWHPWEDHKISYAARKELGGGVINTITHELDLIQYFFNEPQSVFCQSKNFDKLTIDVEEMCEAIFEYKDKLVTLHLDYLQKDYDRNIKILCDEGKILWNWHENKIQVMKHKEKAYEIKLDAEFIVNQLYIDELNDFFSLVEKKQQQHPLDKNHAINNTLLMLSMHESTKLESKVQLKKWN